MYSTHVDRNILTTTITNKIQNNDKHCSVATLPMATWHLDSMLERWVVGVVSLPHPHHVIVPLLSCVSGRWVGMNIRQGILTMVSKITEQQQTMNVSHHLLFGWHIAVSDMAPGFHVREINGEGGEVTLLTLAHHCLFPFLSPRHRPWTVGVDFGWGSNFICGQLSSSFGQSPASCVKKGEGEGGRGSHIAHLNVHGHRVS